MADNVTPTLNPASQQVDPSRFGTDIQISNSSHPINVDLAVQLAFLQYNQLSNLRTQDKLDEVQNTLSQMNEARNMYNRMKQLKQQAGGGVSTMPDDMVAYLKANGIDYDHTGNDNIHNKNEWDINMSYLDSHIQKISGMNKTQMLELNQCVEDGNTALREVSTTFAKNTEVLQSIIQTINR